MILVLEMLLAGFLLVILYEEACNWQELLNKIKAIKSSATLLEAMQMSTAQREAKLRVAK